MFNDESIARASRLLAMYGATHFHVGSNGDVMATVGSQNFPMPGVHFQIEPTADELTAAAVALASDGSVTVPSLAERVSVAAFADNGHGTGEAVPEPYELPAAGAAFDTFTLDTPEFGNPGE